MFTGQKSENSTAQISGKARTETERQTDRQTDRDGPEFNGPFGRYRVAVGPKIIESKKGTLTSFQDSIDFCNICFILETFF